MPSSEICYKLLNLQMEACLASKLRLLCQLAPAQYIQPASSLIFILPSMSMRWVIRLQGRQG